MARVCDFRAEVGACDCPKVGDGCVFPEGRMFQAWLDGWSMVGFLYARDYAARLDRAIEENGNQRIWRGW